MGAENSKFRASSLKILRTLSGRRYREQSSKSSSAISMENINQSRSDRNKNSSSRQQSGGKPKSESVRYKTKWPYPHVEKDFLPVYNMKNETQKDFTIIQIIASGAYGSVLKGFDNKTRRDVAIKVIDKSRVLSEGHGAIQQCKDEVLIQSDLPSSPYIVQLVSFWQTRNRLYLVLEYIPNGELFELWKIIRTFSESLARFYLSQVAMAIEFLHRNNVVYRDLKMENILLDCNAHIKLIDFGLSKRLVTNDRTTTTCGTLQYTAPEVLKGEPYGHNVDWWSMGVLGYALLNGKFPVFGAKNHVEMRTMVANNQYRMPLHLSNEAADMLTSLLQKNPLSRVQSLDDLMTARYFKFCLNYSGSKLDLKHFVTKQDIDKIPEVFPLKPIFEIAYNESISPELSVLSDSSDYAEPIWKMSSGKNSMINPVNNYVHHSHHHQNNQYHQSTGPIPPAQVQYTPTQPQQPIQSLFSSLTAATIVTAGTTAAVADLISSTKKKPDQPMTIIDHIVIDDGHLMVPDDDDVVPDLVTTTLYASAATNKVKIPEGSSVSIGNSINSSNIRYKPPPNPPRRTISIDNSQNQNGPSRFQLIPSASSKDRYYHHNQNNNNSQNRADNQNFSLPEFLQEPYPRARNI